MAHFNFQVDTDPMADSIDTVASHVDGTTAAVVAMQTAVVIAENKGAKNICDKVNHGFYSLIRSQISQKIATHKSKADAKIMELQQQTASLATIKTRLEKDYMMLANRYTKLFSGLNKSLRTRIFEVDKPAANFVNKELAAVANRMKQLAGTPAVSQGEALTFSQKISVSNTKHNTMRNISSMQEFIFNSQSQKALIDRILTSEAVKRVVEKYIPVIVSGSESLNIRQTQWKIFQPHLNQNKNANVEAFLYSSMEKLNWAEADDDNLSRVKKKFSEMIAGSELPDRIKSQMRLFIESARWQKLSEE